MAGGVRPVDGRIQGPGHRKRNEKISSIYLPYIWRLPAARGKIRDARDHVGFRQ